MMSKRQISATISEQAWLALLKESEQTRVAKSQIVDAAILEHLNKRTEKLPDQNVRELRQEISKINRRLSMLATQVEKMTNERKRTFYGTSS